jgi:putative endonuclease
MHDYWVYIVTNLPRRTVLYIGMTNSLEIRLAQHRAGVAHGFTWQNNTHALVYYENFPEPQMAIAREKQLKRWTRRKKEVLIERANPGWRDLSIELFSHEAEEVAGGTRGSSAPLHSTQNDPRGGVATQAEELRR